MDRKTPAGKQKKRGFGLFLAGIKKPIPPLAREQGRGHTHSHHIMPPRSARPPSRQQLAFEALLAPDVDADDAGAPRARGRGPPLPRDL